jgi:formylglycine-generating enzyme required for sulfatase activity
MIFGLNSVEAKSSKVWIAAGTFTPLYGFGKKEKTEYRVAPFFLDLYPVTRRDFFLFLKKNPAWQKGKVDLLYADESYLKEFELNRLPRSPVVYVSWFAAEAYCRAQGGRLPTVLEWERCQKNESRIEVALFECLEGDEDVWSFYGQSRVAEGSPSRVQYYWAARKLAQQLQGRDRELAALIDFHRRPASEFEVFRRRS